MSRRIERQRTQSGGGGHQRERRQHAEELAINVFAAT